MRRVNCGGYVSRVSSIKPRTYDMTEEIFDGQSIGTGRNTRKPLGVRFGGSVENVSVH